MYIKWKEVIVGSANIVTLASECFSDIELAAILLFAWIICSRYSRSLNYNETFVA